MLCLNCNESPAVKYSKYSAGDFCSKKCSKSFSTKAKRQDINKKVAILLKGRATEEPSLYRFVSCCVCYCEYSVFYKNKKKSCSSRCSNYLAMNSDAYKKVDHSARMIKAYENGREVSGGKTKWYSYLRRDGTSIRIQGSYELRVCKILDSWAENGLIENWEYTKDRVPYIGLDNKSHKYLLDFKVFLKDSFHYIEVKGFFKEVDKLKLKAASDFGYDVKVWTLDEIELAEINAPEA